MYCGIKVQGDSAQKHGVHVEEGTTGIALARQVRFGSLCNQPYYPNMNIFCRFFRAGFALFGVIYAHIAAAQSVVALDHRHPGVQAVMALQGEVTPGLMSTPAVLGTAIGADASSQPVLIVYVDHENGGMAAAIRSIPPQLRGIATKIELTEKFRAFAAPPKGGGSGETVNHKSIQTSSGGIQLGTSGGWRYDLANGYCCGGTLGALVKINGTQYILSNYHVLEADIVLGGNQRIALTGEFIVQPGLIDVNCTAANAQDVATLVRLNSLPNSNVDCAIAQVIPGKVRSDGAILEIGTISSELLPNGAYINQGVKKSGRTTGLSKSAVSGLNATISISYENECAGGAAFSGPKIFTGQIVIANRGSKFLYSGDSGSLMVENVETKPKAVGLLFAGSSTSAIANPINDVIKFLSEHPSLGGSAQSPLSVTIGGN